jgi:CRISPR-associated protein Cmr5
MGRLAEQDRAKDAFERVSHHKVSNDAGEYRQLVRGLPAMVQQCGLGQTMAFLASKREGHYAMALDDIREWLKRFDYAKGKDGVLKALMDGDSRGYKMATTEALAYLQWLKRFAEAAIEKPERG